MRKALLVGALMLVTGCGGEFGEPGKGPTAAETVPPQVSGSRLKMIWKVGTDGSKIASGAFFDTQFGVKCVVAGVSDGVEGCAPQESVVSLGDAYADDACTQPAVSAPDGTRFVRQGSHGILLIGDALPQLFGKSGSTCSPRSVSAGSQAFSLGGLAPLVTFSDAQE